MSTPRAGTAPAWSNWGRSALVHPAERVSPTTTDQVVAIVRRAAEQRRRVKAVGAGHSFTGIAVATDILIEPDGLAGVLAVDGNLVTLGAGTRLWQLPDLLAPLGLAMQNLGDIDRQTIAGAISTGTHGTGARFGGISTQVRGLVLVTGDGTVLRVSASENADLLPAVALGLGALGVITEVTIECVPAFVLGAIERPEPFDAVVDAFEHRAASVDHFEFLWFPHTRTVLTKNNTRLPADSPRAPLGPVRRWFDDRVMSNRVFGLTCVVGAVAPRLVPGINRLATRLTGNREFTDVSTSVFTTQRSVRFRELEYSIPLEQVPDALRALRSLIDSRGWRISFPVEVRAAAHDDLWLSTATGRASGYIAVHRYFREEPTEYFRAADALFREFEGRPHWGKIHFQDAESLSMVYPRFGEFVQLRDRLDPERLFANEYLDTVLGR
ncbi:D-arabinono-1,4-lactone oxidase [Cryobacterium sp. BB736]|uniref:D-arabinono-1,4-lactone oxidase n=1 Tax=Cryobacterium sp. BB736 TaxID=2746963 RepID=UPI001873D561